MNFDIKEMINSIVEFFQIVIAEVMKALDGIKKVHGYDDPANYPEDFTKAE